MSDPRRTRYLQVKACEWCGCEYSRAGLAHPVGNAHWEKRRFCDRECRAAALSPAGSKECEECGETFHRADLPPKSDAQWKRRRFCAQRCQLAHNRRGGEAAPRWLGDAAQPQSANRRAVKAFPVTLCNRCETTEKLHRHHIDGNQFNNVPENIEVLCARCHRQEHAARQRRAKTAA